ncbi:WD40 repeat-like protein [Trichoderma evansii]
MATTNEVLDNTFGDGAKLHIGNNITNNTTVNADPSAADNIFLQEISKTNPVDDKKRILESKGPLIYESYCWILEHNDFKNWRDKEKSGVFWIKGNPGKGKTMLLCGIIEHFENDSKPQEKISYFFCQGTDTRLNTATAIIKGLIYSVLRQNQNLLSSIQKQVEKEPKGYLEGTNAWVALSRIFTTILQDPYMADFIFIIDALDECQNQESRKSLLNLIMDTSNRAKWLISSRNEKEIERGLKSIENKLILELQSNAAHISKAVDTYIDRCARDIEAFENDVDLRNKTINLLKKKANGTFLWVTLVVQQLRDAGHPHIERILEEMPEDLESLYDEIMERSKKGWKDDKEACLVFLATVTAAERPLRIDELYIFTSSQLIDTKVKYLSNHMEYLAKACGSFITITDNTIYLIHQSVKDYMMQKGAISIFPKGIEHQHSKMLEISLRIMDKTLRRNIYNIKSPGEHVDNIIPPNPNPLAAIAYCCTFWIEHLAHCRQPYLFQEGGILHSFLKEKSLNWLEAMTLLKSLAQAVIAIQKLRDLIANYCIIGDNSYRASNSSRLRKRKRGSVGHDQWPPNAVMTERKTERKTKMLVTNERNEALELTRDIYRLVFSHRAIIEAFPLQIYASALIFSPSECILRILFEVTQCPKWIIAKPTTRPKWSPCIQTIEGYESDVDSVAISPDNTMLGVAAAEGTAKIWDLMSGACLHTFKAKNVKKMAFSPNSIQLALVTTTQVEIWDLITGTPLKTMYGYFESVSFSADGAILALIGRDMIKIHDLATNMDLQTHYIQSGEEFLAVIFPSDCAQLESAFGDGTIGSRNTGTEIGASVLTARTFHATLVVLVQEKLAINSYLATESTIKILDLVTGKCVQSMAVDMDSIDKQTMTVSSDGMRLALISNDWRIGWDIISIWDLATGKCLQTFECQRRNVEEMVFSADGMRLAFTKNLDIKIWDIATGKFLQTFSGHEDYVKSLAYSPDGLRLVSGARDRTIKLWDLNANSSQQLLTRPISWSYQDQIYLITFSPDGRWVALSSVDRTVRIWDAATGAFLRTMNMSANSNAIVYSPDSMQLATSEGFNGVITFWDAATGAHLGALKGHADAVVSIAFSPSNAQLASGSRDASLKTWDLTSGTCLHTIEIDWDVTSTIAFSPGGTQLGSISNESTIKIWDPFTGECLQTLENCLDATKWNYSNSILSRYNRVKKLFASFSQEQHVYYNYIVSDLSLNEDQTWILKNDKPVLWLPVDYRPRLIEIYENCLVIVNRYNEFLYFRFCFDDADI